MSKPFILFCAGEDSGDILGEDFVAVAVARGLDARGTGGARMQAAGLIPLANFEHLPVSGFFDVLPKYLQLRRCFDSLRQALLSEDCEGLIAIDYPGFNMKLCALAKSLGKKVLYVAPPQVWAWKKNRGKKLQGVDLAVLFEFEKDVYEKMGCRAELLQHPFLTAVDSCSSASREIQEKILLLPGSRKRQALRNLKFYLSALSELPLQPQGRVEVVAARQSLVPVFEQALRLQFQGEIPAEYSVIVVPKTAQERVKIFGDARLAISPPGTVSLELALSGTPQVVAMKPDPLTYLLGKSLVKIPYFAMPNILLNRMVIPEIMSAPWHSTFVLSQTIKETRKTNALQVVSQLKEKLKGGQSAAKLFGKFFQCDSH